MRSCIERPSRSTLQAITTSICGSGEARVEAGCRHADGVRGMIEVCNVHRGVLGVEQSVDLRAAGSHPLRHRRFADFHRPGVLGVPGEGMPFVGRQLGPSLDTLPRVLAPLRPVGGSRKRFKGGQRLQRDSVLVSQPMRPIPHLARFRCLPFWASQV
jgi:hypothetical protein